MQGRVTETTLATGVVDLWKQGVPQIAVLVGLTSVAAPGAGGPAVTGEDPGFTARAVQALAEGRPAYVGAVADELAARNDWKGAAAPLVAARKGLHRDLVQNGAIFQTAMAGPSSPQYRPLFEDLRARHVGDTIVIQLNERTAASKNASSSASKSAPSAACSPERGVLRERNRVGPKPRR